MSDPAKYYRILGLDGDASPKEIKRAYRKLSLRYHPDKNTKNKDGEKFREITEAYQFLKSEKKKIKKLAEKNAESAHAEFWQFYNNKREGGFHSQHKANFYKFRSMFGNETLDSEGPNQEKPVSQKVTHFLLYGGLGIMAIWIILSEILK